MDDEDSDSDVRPPGDANMLDGDHENVKASLTDSLKRKENFETGTWLENMAECLVTYNTLLAVIGRGHKAASWKNPLDPAPPSHDQMPPLLKHSPSSHDDVGRLEDPARNDVGKAGFGDACGPGESCISSLGLVCLRTERQGYRCGCANETPVFINDGGVKKCVRAKSMYESCVSHLECSYQIPNLQCVDFLCYCPLPYVLTESHQCLAPSGHHNRLVLAIVPTVVLIAVLFMIGGAYTYKKMVCDGDGWTSASSLFTLRSSSERPSEPARRVSSAIRLSSKGGSGRRRPCSLAEYRAALREARTPRHPPRYIRPREQSVQKLFLQDVRVKKIEESMLSSESSVMASHRKPQHSADSVASKAINGPLILPVHEEESVHIIRKSPTSGRASRVQSTDVPRLRQFQREDDQRVSPTRLLRKILDDIEVKVNVERSTCSSNQDDQRPPPPKLFGDHSGSQPSEPPASKFQGWAKMESTTEDSFMREIRYRVEASSPKPSVQDRAISTNAPLTTDSTVQLDKPFPGKIDKSQQMSDAPSLGLEHTEFGPAKTFVQEAELKPVVPVHRLVQEMESKQIVASKTIPAAKQAEERAVKSEIISMKERTKNDSENFDNTYTHGGKQGRSSTSPGVQLGHLRRISTDSLPNTAGVAVGTPPPLPESAKDDPQRPVESDFVHVTTEKAKDTDKAKNCGTVKTRMLASPIFGPKVYSDVSIRCPTFRDVLQEGILKDAQKKSAVSVPSHEGALRQFSEETPPPLCGTSPTKGESATDSSPEKVDVSPQRSVKESPFLLMPLEVTKNVLTPICSRVYSTKVEDFDILCPAVQGAARAVVKVKSSNEARSTGEHDIKESASLSSLNMPTAAIEESGPRLVRRSLRLSTVRDDGKLSEERADPKQQTRFRQSSDNLVTNTEWKSSEQWAQGHSCSTSRETPPEGSRLDGYIPPNSPVNGGPEREVFGDQELKTATAAADQTLMFPTIENNWNLTSPEAVLGSMDVESSETSLGGLRATFKQSVDVTCHMLVPRDEATFIVPALKNKTSKGSERKKRVNFLEKPFMEVLAEIEDDCVEPAVAQNIEGDEEQRANSDTAAEKSTHGYRQDDKKSRDDEFIEYSGRTVERNYINEVGNDDEKNENNAPSPITLLQDVHGQHVSRQIMTPVSAQVQHVGADRSIVEWRGPKELTPHNTEPTLQSSREVISKETLVSHPFVPSDEAPLPPSASTTLSFLSSESNASIVHRETDLASLHTFEELAAPFQETGDGKSRTAAANLLVKPGSRQLQRLQYSQREPLPHHQEGEQQSKGYSTLSSERTTPAEDRSACSSRRLRISDQAKLRGSREARSPRLPKHPNTGERQRVGRFAAKERRWGDIIQVIMMGNKHYLHERSTTSPRPLSASIATLPPLDETQYISQQIELAHTTDRDAAHTLTSPEFCLAAGEARTVAVREEMEIAPVLTRALSPCTGTLASVCTVDYGREQQLPLTSSGQESQQSSPRAHSRPLSAVTSSDALATVLYNTWNSSGELPAETIAKTFYEIELHDPQQEAGGPKVSELVTENVCSGDTAELVKSPGQIGVTEDSTEHFIPSLTSELTGESRLTPTWPLWDAPKRELLASVQMHSAAVATPESTSKTIGLPSAEGLLMSGTSTLASRVDAVTSSSIGCSVVLDPSVSTLSHARIESSKSAQEEKHSASIIEGPCFESIYNAILQPGSSSSLSLSIPRIGSCNFGGLLGIRERPSGSTSESSATRSRAHDSTHGGAVAVEASASRSSILASDFSAPHPSEDGSHRALMPHTAGAVAVFEKCDDELKNTPHTSGGVPPKCDSGRGVSQIPNPGAIQPGDAVVACIQDDTGSDDDERSSFFSFEESESETSLLPDTANLDWSASSAASRNREDRD